MITRLVLLAVLIGLPPAVCGGSAIGNLPPGTKPVPFERQHLWGYRDIQGNVVLEPVYFYADSFLDGGIAAVIDDSGWVYIDTGGRALIRPFIVDNGPDYFSEGLARFEVDSLIGFFDGYGAVVLPPQFDFVFPFHEGLAATCAGCTRVAEGEYTRIEGGKWGYVNVRGELVIPRRFDFAFNFNDGVAEVELDGVLVKIDREGTILK